MSFNKMTRNVLNISALDNKPSCSAAELKATFDAAGVSLKDFINGLIDQITAETAAQNIGANVSSVATKTLQAILTAFENAINNRYTKTETDTLVAQTTNDMVADFDVNLTTGVITITRKDGTVETYDTALEKVPATFTLIEENGIYYLKITNVDGTATQINVNTLFNEYLFNNSSEISFTSTGEGQTKTITATIRDNSIGKAKLNLSLISELEGYVQSARSSAEAASTSAASASGSAETATRAATSAGESASNAESSKNVASGSATTATTNANLAQSYAVGGTGTREGEDEDNAKYYSERVANKEDKANKTSVVNAGSNNTQYPSARAVYNAIQAGGSPLVASSVAEMTNTSKVYVNTTDGNWYYYDGNSWSVGGIYQSTAIDEENHVIAGINDKINKINSDLEKVNYFDASNSIEGKKLSYATTYTINTLQDANNGVVSNIIKVSQNDIVRINYGFCGSGSNINYGIVFADDEGNILEAERFDNIAPRIYEKTITNPQVTQIRFAISKLYNTDYANNVMCTINREIPASFVPYDCYYKNNQLVKMATADSVGGIIAEEFTATNGEEVKIDPATGKLYIEKRNDNRKMYLPKIVYHKSGETFRMPYRSIYWAHDMDSVYFKATSLNDHTSAKVLQEYYQRINLSSSVDENLFALDSKSDVLLEKKAFSIKSVDVSLLNNPLSQKNLLIVGDSFINNGNIPDYFNEKITEYGLTNINFIGLKRTSNGTKHEGHGGHCFIDYISDPSTLSSTHTNPFWNSNSNQVDFNYYASQCGVSIIDYMYVHLGVNDLLSNTSIEDICLNLETFINYAKTAFPDIKIIVDGLVIPSLLCPSNYNPILHSKKIFELNESIELKCSSLTNVYYSPIIATFNAEYAYPYNMVAPFEGSTELIKVLTDYLHPYKCGYNMISYQSLMCFLYNCIQDNN